MPDLIGWLLFYAWCAVLGFAVGRVAFEAGWLLGYTYNRFRGRR